MGREYPTRPVMSVAGIVFDRHERVLLVKRGRPPLEGQWSLPGGVLDLGEKLADGVRREVREETGLEVEVLELVELFERITPGADGRIRYHYVVGDYLCAAAGGELRAGSDAAETAWFERGRLAQLPITPGTPAIIEKAFRMHADRLFPQP